MDTNSMIGAVVYEGYRMNLHEEIRRFWREQREGTDPKSDDSGTQQDSSDRDEE